MIRRSWTRAALIDEMLALWAASLREIKKRIRPLFSNDKILIILEGRDVSGKDGTIKPIVQHLSPRETRVVALGKPSDPRSYDLVIPTPCFLFASGPRARAFYPQLVQPRRRRTGHGLLYTEHEEFMGSVLHFENMLVRSGVKLFKYYLDISKDEQKRRLEDRETDPLKRWKTSPIDDQAIKYWKAYSIARNEMLARTQETHEI